MIGINEFSADTYIEKNFQGVRLYHICKAVVECVHTNKYISVEVMNNADMQEHLDAIMCYEKKSYLAYEVKKTGVSIQGVKVGKLPYIFIAGYPKANNASNEFGNDVLRACESVCEFLKEMIFLNSAI